LRQTYRFPPVAFQGCDLSEPFRFGFGFKLEKLPAVVKWTEIKILGMSFIVGILEDSKSWALHGPK